MLSWVVTFCPSPRRSPKSHSHCVLPHSMRATGTYFESCRLGIATCDSSFSSLLPNFQLSIGGSKIHGTGDPDPAGTVDSQLPFPLRKSFPVISFADPHPLTLLESYRLKNREVGRGASIHPSVHSHKPFICNTYRPNPTSVANKRLTAQSESRLSPVDATPTKNMGGGGPYILTSLLPVCSIRPIAVHSLWCNNPQRDAISLRPRETTPLLPVSKTTRADNGTSSWSPLQVVPGSSVLRF